MQQDVEIQSIASGGDGVARSDGLVIFVPRTAPGDVVRIQATAVSGGHFARGTLQEVLVPSADRVDAPCIHYTRDVCGGCQLQHLRYEAQLAAKGAIVRDALAHIAHRSVGPVPVAASGRQWRYRHKLTLALRRGEGGHWTAGLHRLHAPGDVFPVEDCTITDERVIEIWRQVMRSADLLPDASAFRAAIRISDRGCSFILEGGQHWPRRAAFEAAVSGITEVWWTPEGKERREVGKMESREREKGTLEPEGSAEPRTGASFTQINPEVGRALCAEVVERVLAYAPDAVIDAYAGTGATAVALARTGVRVTAIEADANAGAYCASVLPSGSRTLVARVEDALAGALPTDVVVVNPPRVGLAAPVTAILDQAAPRTKAVIYVSCDPATLARDVSRLASWRIASVRAFDMFPQTAHVETVCELVPESAAI